MEKINWGILGLGEIAHKFSEGFIETSNAKLLAAASKDQEKSKKFKDQFNIESKYLFNSYEELINCEDVDVVYIALPNFLHHEWALKSIKNKKHILVEKPVTLNLKEIKNSIWFLPVYFEKTNSLKLILEISLFALRSQLPLVSFHHSYKEINLSTGCLTKEKTKYSLHLSGVAYILISAAGLCL